MSSDPPAAPTDEQWNANAERFSEADRRHRTANDEYLAAFKAWHSALEEWAARPQTEGPACPSVPLTRSAETMRARDRSRETNPHPQLEGATGRGAVARVRARGQRTPRQENRT
jgi:hypothetical protein